VQCPFLACHWPGYPHLETYHAASGSKCRNPTLREVWGRHSHSRKWDLGVLRDSQKLRMQLQGSKHLSLYCWKGFEASMSKMALHEPFGHLQHKLWSKEGPWVKLAIWLSTTKSWESTRSRCVQVKCNTSLKSSQGQLQVCFRPCPNRRSEREVINAQSPKSPNQDSFETPLWESREKLPFRCKCNEETQRVLHGGRWWLPLNPSNGESSESKVARGLSQHPECSKCELTH